MIGLESVFWEKRQGIIMGQDYRPGQVFNPAGVSASANQVQETTGQPQEQWGSVQGNEASGRTPAGASSTLQSEQAQQQSGTPGGGGRHGKAPKEKKPFWKKWWFWLIVVIVVAIAASSGSNSGSSSSSSSASASSVESSSAAAPATSSTTTTPATLTGIKAEYDGDMTAGTKIEQGTTGIEVTAEYSDGSTKDVTDGWTLKNTGTLAIDQSQTYTVEYQGKTATFTVTADPPTEYQNALTKAQEYSDSMYMSQKGIYDQLTSSYGEGFTADAANYAIKHVNADYNKNALEKAKQYQSEMSMSKSAIYEQLVSSAGEQFTAAQAQYAIDNLGN